MSFNQFTAVCWVLMKFSSQICFTIREYA